MRSLSRPPVVRYRVRVSRTGAARALTHLEQIEALRRAVAGSGMPALTDGRRSRPRPRLAFGPAISVGYESQAEYFDLELASVLAPQEVASALGRTLTEGFAVREVRRIPAFFPSLDASINVVRYEIHGEFPPEGARALEGFLSRERIVIEKVKKEGAVVERIDVRPLIREMALVAPGCLSLTLRFGPKRTVKPEAVLREWLGVPEAGPERFRIVRKELLSETAGGELLTP